MSLPDPAPKSPPAPPGWYAQILAGLEAVGAGKRLDGAVLLTEGTEWFRIAWRGLPPPLQWTLLLNAGVWGNVVNAHVILAELLAPGPAPAPPGGPPPPCSPGYARDRAFEQIERILEYGWRETPGAGLEDVPALKPLHADPRWADAVRRSRSKVSGVPSWVYPIQRAGIARVASEYPAAAKAYMDFLIAVETAKLDMPPDAFLRLEALPEMRAALAPAFYHCACAVATTSAGDASIVLDAAKITGEKSLTFRDRAFDYLKRAVDLGWRDEAAAHADPHLAALRGDPRWTMIFGVWN